MHRTLSDTERNLIIVTAPSGAGKTSLIKNVLKYSKENNKKVFLSVSHTTRQPRKGEQHGIDYIFIGESEFRENVNDNSYIEYYENVQIRKDKTNRIIVQYVQTTPGRVIFNYTIQNTLKLFK